MLFHKLSLYSFLAVIAASPITCLADAEKAVAGVNIFASNLREAHQALQSYGDGQVTGYTVAKKFDHAHRSAKKANLQLREAGPLSAPDARKVVDAYNQLQPETLGVLRTVSEKATSMKSKVGVAYVAQGIVGNFQDENNAFHDTLRQNLPKDQQESLSPNMSKVDSAFTDTRKAIDV
ncbi:uncharacterized protein N7498_010611 [Penicillium cinerascens]|uniref:Uncharacterized protein n=1 Tax=Penicillium cinerascens TaxID=70096 RepID=A0A9W9JC58_9EURO|nr:uncharacterized protein N7498_010611 [Penicillium cinerascens]KAJ5191626.1 hypothetical protein N7498_010611 [Penicillium cinerascens]